MPIDAVTVRLGDSAFPVFASSGGQFGLAHSTDGVHAACVMLREQVVQRLGFDAAGAVFANGRIASGGRSASLKHAAATGELVGEDRIEFSDLDKTHQLSTLGAQFVEVGVDAYTGATCVRRLLAVCAACRIINPTSRAAK